jgi:hypothetical protein
MRNPKTVLLQISLLYFKVLNEISSNTYLTYAVGGSVYRGLRKGKHLGG